MSENSKIEWTDHTFNPWIGCTEVSPGFAHCYAKTLMQIRRKRVVWGKGQPRLRTVASTWNQPRQWNKAAASYPDQCTQCGARVNMAAQLKTGNNACTALIGPDEKEQPIFRVCGGEVALNVRPKVFCASLADVFDDEVPIEWLADLLALIDECKNLDWQLLTKRPENIASRMDAAMHGNFDRFATFAEHMPHVWLGVSAENQEQWNFRLWYLKRIEASVHFVSAEPLLGPIEMANHQPDWLIVGGESGPGARFMKTSWVESLREQCIAREVAFHFKQWGGVNKKEAGRELDGLTWDELPTPRKP